MLENTTKPAHAGLPVHGKKTSGSRFSLKRGYVLCLQSRIVFVAVFEAGSGQTFCLVIQTVDRIYNFLIIDNLIT